MFSGGRIYVFEREKMIQGLPARMQSAELGQEFGFLPGDLDSLTPPPVGEAAFLLGPNRLLTNLTDSFRVAVTWGATPTIVATAGTPIMGGRRQCAVRQRRHRRGARLRAAAATSAANGLSRQP